MFTPGHVVVAVVVAFFLLRFADKKSAFTENVDTFSQNGCGYVSLTELACRNVTAFPFKSEGGPNDRHWTEIFSRSLIGQMGSMGWVISLLLVSEQQQNGRPPLVAQPGFTISILRGSEKRRRKLSYPSHTRHCGGLSRSAITSPRKQTWTNVSCAGHCDIAYLSKEYGGIDSRFIRRLTSYASFRGRRAARQRKRRAGCTAGATEFPDKGSRVSRYAESTRKREV